MARLLQMFPIRGARGVGVACAAVALAWSGGALADANVAAAANAFSRAQKAALAGDYATAAELFELADSLAPTPEALRSALGSRRAQGQLASAAAHAEELLVRYSDDPESNQLANDTLTEAKQRYGRQRVSCSPEPCLLLIDGAAAGSDPKPRHIVYLAPGNHSLVAVFGDRRTEPRQVESAVGSDASLSFEAPPARAAVRSAARSSDSGGEPTRDREVAPKAGLSPWFFGVGAGVSVLLGAATIWSGLDTLSAHDDYEKSQTQAGYEHGQELERRTNLLLGATAISTAATITLAIFTDWSGSDSKPSARIGAGAIAGNPALVVRGAF
jgi:hypothetical protein